MFDEIKIFLGGFCFAVVLAISYGMCHWARSPEQQFDYWKDDQQAAYICAKSAMAFFYPMQSYRKGKYTAENVEGQYITAVETTLEDTPKKDKLSFMCFVAKPQGKWVVIRAQQIY